MGFTKPTRTLYHTSDEKSSTLMLFRAKSKQKRPRLLAGAKLRNNRLLAVADREAVKLKAEVFKLIRYFERRWLFD